MTDVALYKQDGSKNGTVALNDGIFAIEPNNNVVFDAIVMQRASLRQGTHSVKTVQQFEAVERSLGVKRVPVELDKVQSDHHNGVAVELSSDLLHVHTHTVCLRKFHVWH